MIEVLVTFSCYFDIRISVKSAFRIFSDLYFPVFGPEKILSLGTFYAGDLFNIFCLFVCLFFVDFFFLSEFLDRSLIHETCHNYRTKNKTDMQPDPQIPLKNRNTLMFKRSITVMPWRKILSYWHFRFLTNMDCCGNQNPKKYIPSHKPSY